LDNANVGDIDVNRVQQDSLFISKEIKKEYCKERRKFDEIK
jgi:hypothetical protein